MGIQHSKSNPQKTQNSERTARSPHLADDGGQARGDLGVGKRVARRPLIEPDLQEQIERRLVFAVVLLVVPHLRRPSSPPLVAADKPTGEVGDEARRAQSEVGRPGRNSDGMRM